MAATGGGAELARPPEMARSVDPDPALADAFDAGHARYRAVRDRISGLD